MNPNKSMILQKIGMAYLQLINRFESNVQKEYHEKKIIDPKTAKAPWRHVYTKRDNLLEVHWMQKGSERIGPKLKIKLVFCEDGLVITHKLEEN